MSTGLFDIRLDPTIKISGPLLIFSRQTPQFFSYGRIRSRASLPSAYLR